MKDPVPIQKPGGSADGSVPEKSLFLKWGKQAIGRKTMGMFPFGWQAARFRL